MPNHQSVARKMEARSEHAHVACTSLHVPHPICMLSRCLSTKISASELSRKFIKSVGCWLGVVLRASRSECFWTCFFFFSLFSSSSFIVPAR